MGIDITILSYMMIIYLVVYSGSLFYLSRGASFPKGYILVACILTFFPPLALIYLIIIVFLRDKYVAKTP
jgi:hypothetical protein